MKKRKLVDFIFCCQIMGAKVYVFTNYYPAVLLLLHAAIKVGLSYIPHNFNSKPLFTHFLTLSEMSDSVPHTQQINVTYFNLE